MATALSLGPATFAATGHDDAQQARMLYADGDIENAIKSFTAAISSTPSDWTLYSERGIARGEIGQLKPALADLNKAIAMSGFSGSETVKARGNAVENVDPHDKAKAYFNRAKIESQLQLHQAAIKDLKLAHKLDAEDAAVLNNLADEQANIGAIASAVLNYRLAIKTDPEYAEAYDGLGMALERCGDKQKAIESYNKAIKLDPSSAKAFFNRHRIKLAFGDTTGALRDLHRSAELYESVGQLEMCDEVLETAKAIERPSTLSQR